MKRLHCYFALLLIALATHTASAQESATDEAGRQLATMFEGSSADRFTPDLLSQSNRDEHQQIKITFQIAEMDAAVAMFVASRAGQVQDDADAQQLHELIELSAAETISFSVMTRNGEPTQLYMLAHASTITAVQYDVPLLVSVQLDLLFGLNSGQRMRHNLLVPTGDQVLVPLRFHDMWCSALISAEVVTADEAAEPSPNDLSIDQLRYPVLHGTVRDASGTPLPNVVVHVYDKYGFLSSGQYLNCITDENGEYRITRDRIVPKPFNWLGGRFCWPRIVQVSVQHPTLIASTGRDQCDVRIPGIEGAVIRKDFTLMPGSMVSGRVVDQQTGDPVEGLELYIWHRGNSFNVFSRKATTDATGRFSIATMYPQQYFVEDHGTATRLGFNRPLTCEIEVVAGVEENLLLYYDRETGQLGVGEE